MGFAKETFMKSKRALFGRVFAAVLTCGLLGAATQAAEKTKPSVGRDTLIVALDKEIQSLDALITASGDSQRYALQIFDSLMGFDAKGAIVPRMAESYRISSDGLTYTFNLRRGIRFHNGDVLTSEDVKYSIERVIDPVSKSTRRPFFAPVVDSVQTPNANTAVIKLKKQDGAFLNKMAGFLFIVPKKLHL
jgi:peptide/nickel transport system substrate-binding protein